MPTKRPTGVLLPVSARSPSGSGLFPGGVGVPSSPGVLGSGAGDDGGSVGLPVSDGVGVGVGLRRRRFVCV